MLGVRSCIIGRRRKGADVSQDRDADAATPDPRDDGLKWPRQNLRITFVSAASVRIDFIAFFRNTRGVTPKQTH